MWVPFLDLRVTDEPSRHELLAAVEKVLVHGRILLGPEVGLFEERIAAVLSASPGAASANRVVIGTFFSA